MNTNNNNDKKTGNVRKINKKKRVVIVSLIISIIILVFILLFIHLGWRKYFTDIDFLKGKILDSGNSGKLFYIFLNLLQTTVIPITNIPTIMAGTYIYGPLEAANLAIVGILVGSVLSFYIGRIFGTKLVNWVIGSENLERYLEMAKGRENVVIFLILLLPGFPDDIICMLAGITSMRFRFFAITILITRTIPIYMISYGTSIIPLDTVWGWTVLILVYATVIFIGHLIFKNWDKILTKIKKGNS